jgi:hypothetical protein
VYRLELAERYPPDLPAKVESGPSGPDAAVRFVRALPAGRFQYNSRMATQHAWNQRFERLQNDLAQIFGKRLRSLVAYETHFGLETGAPDPGAADDHAHAMAIVESLNYADLVACAAKVAEWSKAKVGAPLLLPHDEFARSLDAFPLEFAAIASHHVLVAGIDPFADVRIDAQDVRRACETQAKSHLLHLREGFLEAQGEPAAVGRLIAASVPSFRTLLLNLARLDDVHARSRDALTRHAATTIGAPEALMERLLSIRKAGDVDRSDALRLYSAYLDAIERVARFVDGWAAR